MRYGLDRIRRERDRMRHAVEGLPSRGSPRRGQPGRGAGPCHGKGPGARCDMRAYVHMERIARLFVRIKGANGLFVVRKLPEM